MPSAASQAVIFCGEHCMEGPRRQRFRARRVPLELPVDLTFSGSNRPVAARSVNVSETGMLVRSDLPHAPGTVVRFDLPHAPGTAVRFDVPPRWGGRGEVAWTRAWDDGAVLMGLSLGRSRHALVELLEDHLR